MQLSAQQRLAVEDDKNHKLVMASAGTGKTYTICQHQRYLIEQCGIASSDILCLTFTNRAKNEMIAGSKNVETHVKTLNGLYMDIVRANYEELGYVSQNVIVIDQLGSKQLARDIADELGATLGQPVNKFLEIMLKNAVSSPSWAGALTKTVTLQSNKYALKLSDERWASWIQTNGVKFVIRYIKELVSRGIIDFAVSQLFATNMSKKYAVREAYSEIKFLMVDEIQDVTPGEFDFMLRLFGKNTIFELYGDLNQTIYTWRGSDPVTVIRKFKEYFNKYETYCLIENFRSSPVMNLAGVRFADAINETNLSGLLKPTEDKLTVFGTNDEMYSETIFNLLRDIKIKSNNTASVAILARNRVTLNKLCDKAEAYTTDLKISGPLDAEVLESATMRLLSELSGLASNPCSCYYASRVLDRLTGFTGDKIGAVSYFDPYWCVSSGSSGDSGVSGVSGEREEYYQDLTESIKNKNLVVFDLETTAAEIQNAYIVQIAVKNAVTKEEWSTLVKPPVQVGRSELIHGFSDEELELRGANCAKSIEKLKNMLDGRVVAGHNVWYDIAVLNEELARNGLEPIRPIRVYDTLRESMLYCGGVQNYKLDTMRQFLNINIVPTHNAIDDVNATIAVLATLYKKYISKVSEGNSQEFAPWQMLTDSDVEQLKVIKRQLDKLNDGEYAEVLLWCANNTSSYMYEKCEKILEMYTLDALTPNCKNSELSAIINSTRSDSAGVLIAQGITPAMTIHQSKGCEFDYTIIIDYDDDTRPTFSFSERQEAEDARVFYVALTRAKQRAYFITSAYYATGVNRNIQTIGEDILKFVRVDSKASLQKAFDS